MLLYDGVCRTGFILLRLVRMPEHVSSMSARYLREGSMPALIRISRARMLAGP